MKDYVVYDSEWQYGDKGEELYCASFVYDDGRKIVYHAKEVGGEVTLLYKINAGLLSRPISMGFWSRGPGSDLEKLDERCKALNIPSIVNRTQFGPEIKGRVHIDLHSIFDKMVVKGYIYKKKYKEVSLNALSSALLGHTKLGTGSVAGTMSVEDVKKYCLWDAELAFRLSRLGDVDKKTNMPVEDGKLMQLWESVAKKINRPVANVCHYGMGFIWKAMMVDDKVPETDSRFWGKPAPAPKRKGPFIMEPVPGDHKNIAVLDVASLYPSIVVNHNISPEVMNCTCCEREDMVSKTDESKIWTCQKRQGIISEKFKSLLKERLECKAKGEKVFADGLKIILNAWTGLSNNAYYHWADVRCYDYIIAREWYYIDKIFEVARMNGVEPIYSDTDSVFFAAKDEAGIKLMIQQVKDMHGLIIEHEKTYKKFLITGKKHYIGVKEDGTTVVAAMEGEKNDRPKWINEVFKQFCKDYANEVDPTINLRSEWKRYCAGNVPIEDLSFNVLMHKDGKDYAIGSMMYKIAPDGKVGETVTYYKTRNGVRREAAFQELDPDSYEGIFLSSFEPLITAMGKDKVHMFKDPAKSIKESLLSFYEEPCHK